MTTPNGIITNYHPQNLPKKLPWQTILCLFFTHFFLQPEKFCVESSRENWRSEGAFWHGVNFCLRAVSPWCLVTCSLGTKSPSSRPKRCLSKRIFPPPKNPLNSGLGITPPETNSEFTPEKMGWWREKIRLPFWGQKKPIFRGEPVSF